MSDIKAMRAKLLKQLDERITSAVFWKDKEFFENVRKYIIEVENNLEECEIGYQGTLFLERCKMKDLQDKVAELETKLKKGEQKNENVQNNRKRD